MPLLTDSCFKRIAWCTNFELRSILLFGLCRLFHSSHQRSKTLGAQISVVLQWPFGPQVVGAGFAKYSDSQRNHIPGLVLECGSANAHEVSVSQVHAAHKTQPDPVLLWFRQAGQLKWAIEGMLLLGGASAPVQSFMREAPEPLYIMASTTGTVYEKRYMKKEAT